MKIRIVAIPPGFAPEEIRKEWLGLEIPLAADAIPEDKVAVRVGDQNVGGFQVRVLDAVKALVSAGKTEAAEFWEPYAAGEFVFKKEVCELVI